MIRPFTCVCMLLAAGSGLYLYQTKHRTLVLDQRIADVLKQADAARARTAVLRAEYAALSEPGRLTQLSGRFLALHPSMPTQYVQLAGLDARLPPIESFPKPGELPVPATGTTDADADAPADAPAPVVAAAAAPPIPPAAATAVHVAQAMPPASSRAPRHTPVPFTQYASNLHATPAARPATGLGGAGARTPGTTRITDAAYVAASSRAAFHPAPASVAVVSGSMLGQSSALNLAPPVPVAN